MAYEGAPEPADKNNVLWYKIARALWGGSGSTSAGGGVVSSPQQFSASSSDAIQTTDGTVFTLAAGQAGFIQNIHTEPLYVKYGAGASATALNFVLKAGTGAKDGLGGSIYIDNWIGPVSVAKSGAAASYLATKLS